VKVHTLQFFVVIAESIAKNWALY